MRDKKPWLLAEIKQKTRPVSPHLYYYAKMLKPDIVLQLCSETGIHEKITIEKGVTGFLISADSFLKLLP